jgi:hypothetical protein
LFAYSCTSNFSAIWRLSPLPVTGLQILAYARRSGPLSREGSLSCHAYCDTRPRFIRSHLKDRHPRPTVGFEPPTQGSSDHCAQRSNHCATQAAGKKKSLKILLSSRSVTLAKMNQSHRNANWNWNSLLKSNIKTKFHNLYPEL